jgi:hypothetical protein
MARVYDARQCDCCGELYRYEGAGGVGISFDQIYITSSKDKVQFDDICESCRGRFRVAVNDMLPKFARDKRDLVDADFREVGETPLQPPEPLPALKEEPF